MDATAGGRDEGVRAVDANPDDTFARREVADYCGGRCRLLIFGQAFGADEERLLGRPTHRVRCRRGAVLALCRLEAGAPRKGQDC